MAVLKIYTYPDPILSKRAENVEIVDDSIRTLLDNMAETMYSSDGIGLAAPQVGILKNLVVVDTQDEEQNAGLHQLINPRVTEHSGTVSYEEGCLSFPGITEDVKRAFRVTVSYLDIEGTPRTLEAEDLLAVVFQHEIDHLRGITFVDHLSRLRRRLVLRQYFKHNIQQKA